MANNNWDIRARFPHWEAGPPVSPWEHSRSSEYFSPIISLIQQNWKNFLEAGRRVSLEYGRSDKGEMLVLAEFVTSIVEQIIETKESDQQATEDYIEDLLGEIAILQEALDSRPTL